MISKVNNVKHASCPHPILFTHSITISPPLYPTPTSLPSSLRRTCFIGLLYIAYCKFACFLLFLTTVRSHVARISERGEAAFFEV